MNTQTVTAEMLDAAFLEVSTTHKAWREGKAPGLHVDIAAKNLESLLATARKEFADAHGWEHAPKLSGHHQDVFIDPKTRRKVATVWFSHTDEQKPSVGERLPFAWYYPSSHTAILVRESDTASSTNVERALAAMRDSGKFYARQYRGLKPVLAWLNPENKLAAVDNVRLQRWLLEHVHVSEASALAKEIVRADLTGFPVVDDDTARLV
jgi:hypothetical protein